MYRVKIVWRDNLVTYSGEIASEGEAGEFMRHLKGVAAINAVSLETKFGTSWIASTEANMIDALADLQRRVAKLELLLSGKEVEK